MVLKLAAAVAALGPLGFLECVCLSPPSHSAYVSVSLCLCVSMPPCLHVSVSRCFCVYVSCVCVCVCVRGVA